MKFQVVIDVENAAFEDGNRGTELGRILRFVAEQVEAYHYSRARKRWKVRDVNGNTVGEWEFVD